MGLMLGDLIKKSLVDGHLSREYEDIPVEAVCVDSRQVQNGAMFVAIPGTAARGTDFVGQAVRRGASVVVVPRDELAGLEALMPPGFPVIGVADPRDFAARAAAAFYEYPAARLELVGITGTNGKTTVSWILESILLHAGRHPGVIGTIGRRFRGREERTALTTPDPVSLQRQLCDMVDQGADACVLEVSSHALHQKRVSGCHFEVAVFTNLSRDHLDYHQDMEEYFQAKRLLFFRHRPRVAVINTDDRWGARLAREIEAALPETAVVSCGIESGEVTVPEYSLGAEGIAATLGLKSGAVKIRSVLAGRHNLYNIMLAAAAAEALGVDAREVAPGISAMQTVPGRLEQVEVPRGFAAFVDYAHTPDALEKILKSLRELEYRRIVTVVGCGGERDRGKRPQMAEAAARLSDMVFFTSDNPRGENPLAILRDMVQGIDPLEVASRVRVVPERKSAIEEAAGSLEQGDCLLVAGKGHEDYQIIGDEKIYFDDREVIRRAFTRHHGPAASSCGKNEVSHAVRVPADIPADELAGAIHALDIQGNLRAAWAGLSTDTRTITPGELFWALRGENFDGNRFLPDALEAGASGAVVEPGALESLDLRDYPDAFVITVPDTINALGEFAAWYRRRCGFQVVAITGSCGKTSTRSLAGAVCRTVYPCHETRGNFNNLVGLPLSMLGAPPDTMWGIFEMGMNQPGEIEALCAIATPDIGIITNIGHAHLEGLGSLEAIAEEKLTLWRALPASGTAVMNLDDSRVAAGAEYLKCNRIIGYSMRSCSCVTGQKPEPEVLVCCTGWSATDAGVRFGMRVVGAEGRMEDMDINLSVPGEVNIVNALAAAAAGIAMRVPLEQIREGLEGASGVPARLEQYGLSNGWLLLSDYYNANPTSMKAALDALKQAARGRRRVAILGDMLELGAEAGRLHRELGRYAAESGVEMLLLAGEHAEDMAEGACEAGLADACIRVFPATCELSMWIRERGGIHIPEGAAVLVKASRGMAFEAVARAVEEAGGGVLPDAAASVRAGASGS